MTITIPEIISQIIGDITSPRFTAFMRDVPVHLLTLKLVRAVLPATGKHDLSIVFLLPGKHCFYQFLDFRYRITVSLIVEIQGTIFEKDISLITSDNTKNLA